MIRSYSLLRMRANRLRLFCLLYSLFLRATNEISTRSSEGRCYSEYYGKYNSTHVLLKREVVGALKMKYYSEYYGEYNSTTYLRTTYHAELTYSAYVRRAYSRTHDSPRSAYVSRAHSLTQTY